VRRSILPILALPIAVGHSGLASADVIGAAPLTEGFAVGITGGVQKWSFSSLEEAMGERHDDLAAQGFSLDTVDFDWSAAFGGELSYRFSGGWLVRGQAEWSQFSWNDRDGQSLHRLGGGRDFVSVGTTTEVKTNFVVGSLGIGRVHPVENVAFTWCVGGIIAPVKVVDTVENTVDAAPSDASSEVSASGVGFGIEGVVAVDYPALNSQTLYLEGFYRVGSTEVELDDGAWDSSFTPGLRKIEFTGFGFRLGMRWG
jgi:hypothetical protein